MVWRYVIAIFLSLVVMVAWQLFNPLPPPPAPPPVTPRAAAPPEAAPAAQDAAGAKPAVVVEKPVQPPRERKQMVFTAGSRFEYEADSKAACLSRVSLPDYHESLEAKEPYTLLSTPPDSPGTFTLEVEDPLNPAKPSRIPLDASWDLVRESSGTEDARAVFQYDLDGISIRKVVSSAEPGSSHLKLTLELQNRGTEPKELTYRLYGPAGLDTEDHQNPGSDLELVSGAWGSNDSVAVDILASSKVTHKDLDKGTAAWVGISNNYFTSILFPLAGLSGHRVSFIEKGFADSYPDFPHMEELAKTTFGKPLEQLAPPEVAQLREKTFKNLRVGFRSFKVALAPGAEPVRHEYGIYLGPRVKESLAPYSAMSLDGVNRYGMFGFLVKLFIWLLGFLRTVAFGSWGFAIILLTFVVKVCLHPINRKTQAGMQRFQKQMQKVKPQMDEIKEKYANNRLKMNQEIQKLWRENHINPGQQMAGCLLMFIQLPIWYGLYSTLRYAIGLRQASFFYIADLTRPDMLFHFGTKLPFVGEWFNILPVLYVILTIVNQRMQPKPEDPQMLQQYRMMTFMMVFFGFIFYSFPAGFMLYIMTSAALGIIESKIIKAELRREEERTGGAPGATVGGAGAAGAGSMYPARSKKAEEERAKRGGRG